MITKVLKYTVLSLGLTFVLSSCDDLTEPALENQKDLEALASLLFCSGEGVLQILLSCRKPFL